MDSITIQTYNQLAKDYDQETVDFWKNFPKDFIKKFSILCHGPVLNLGSGPGRDAQLLVEQNLNLTCLDASESMVNMCLEQGLRAIQGDFSNLPFVDGTFGGVWAYTSLLHVPKFEVDQVLDEIARVLVPNGVFGLGLIEGNGEGYRISSGVTEPRWFSLYSQTEIEEILTRHNFKILYLETFKPASKIYLNFICRLN